MVVERVLGLRSIPVEPDAREKNDDDERAFELLRVCIFPHHATSSSKRCQVRNRFASSNLVGGYRDINFKIRVGFKCDSNKGRPLFCSVLVSLHWMFFAMLSSATSYFLVQKALAPGRCEDNGATMFVVA